MFRSYRIGALLGFPIEVNLSFLLVLGIMLFSMGLTGGLAFVAIVFGSVLLHELGHAVVARRLGVHIAGIELHFFGGAAKMTNQPRRANEEIAIAAAGPAVSFVLGGLGLGLAAVTGSWLLTYIGWINIVLGAFNLVPALPMDGGRILRALLTRKYSFERATELAVTAARGFAILLGIYGVTSGNFFLPFLAVLLWFMGAAELRMARHLGQMFSYDAQGYRFRADVVYGRPEGTPGAAPGQRHPLFSLHPPTAARQIVLREHGGRYYIEVIR